MSQRTLRPGLTAAMAAGRGLLAAGWRYDSTTPMADDTTIRDLLHPTGREISARTSRDGEQTTLTMTGLDLVQVAGAITGAGLTAPAAEQPAAEQPATAPESGLVAVLRQLADQIEQHNLPLPRFTDLGGCVESRADVQRWADHLSVQIKMGGTDKNIPVAAKSVPAGDRELKISFQGPSEPRTDRVAELEAEIDRLRAELAGDAR